jgi:hypothetical protein
MVGIEIEYRNAVNVPQYQRIVRTLPMRLGVLFEIIQNRLPALSLQFDGVYVFCIKRFRDGRYVTLASKCHRDFCHLLSYIQWSQEE